MRNLLFCSLPDCSTWPDSLPTLSPHHLQGSALFSVGRLAATISLCAAASAHHPGCPGLSGSVQQGTAVTWLWNPRSNPRRACVLSLCPEGVPAVDAPSSGRGLSVKGELASRAEGVVPVCHGSSLTGSWGHGGSCRQRQQGHFLLCLSRCPESLTGLALQLSQLSGYLKTQKTALPTCLCHGLNV